MTSIILPHAIEYIAEETFCDCVKLNTIKLPKSVRGIGKYAFRNCVRLTSLVFPKDVSWIEELAFFNCCSLEYIYITILQGTPNIADDAFRGCDNILDVYCYSTEVPSASGAFGRCNLYTVTLHVPEDAIEKYEKTEPWCRFGNIVPLL